MSGNKTAAKKAPGLNLEQVVGMLSNGRVTIQVDISREGQAIAEHLKELGFKVNVVPGPDSRKMTPDELIPHFYPELDHEAARRRIRVAGASGLIVAALDGQFHGKGEFAEEAIEAVNLALATYRPVRLKHAVVDFRPTCGPT